MAKTRSKPAAAVPKKKEEATSTIQLDTRVEQPPQVLVLPKDVSSDARIVTIADPATATASRYLICPQKGFFEFTRVAAPKRQQRSWLLASDRQHDDTDAARGYLLHTPDMLLATPIDPLFLLLPSLAADVHSAGQEYLAVSDHIQRFAESSPHLRQLLRTNHGTTAAEQLHQTLEARLAVVCDSMDLADDSMYALALPKLVKELVAKATRITQQGLPASLEDRFVQQALNVPVLSVKRDAATITLAEHHDAAPGAESEPTPEEPCQSTEVSSTSISIAPASHPLPAPDVVPQLLRLRVALDFLTSYIPPSLRSRLRPLLSDVNLTDIDFAPLESHLAHVAAMKKEAHALRSLSDNISRKRAAMEDDDEAIEKQEAKKRKKEEEELKKKNVSHGVKKLLKADTTGMKKLSSFFAKPSAKK